MKQQTVVLKSALELPYNKLSSCKYETVKCE